MPDLESSFLVPFNVDACSYITEKCICAVELRSSTEEHAAIGNAKQNELVGNILLSILGGFYFSEFQKHTLQPDFIVSHSQGISFPRIAKHVFSSFQ